MHIVIKIMGILLIIGSYILGLALVRLALIDPDFKGERGEHMLFEGTLLIVIGLCALKYWLTEED